MPERYIWWWPNPEEKVLSMSPKKMKVEFAPGCFDNFEGTQEELDELVKEIQDKFANMTSEQLAAESRPVNVDELLEDQTLSDDEFETMLSALVERGNRNLQ